MYIKWRHDFCEILALALAGVERAGTSDVLLWPSCTGARQARSCRAGLSSQHASDGSHCPAWTPRCILSNNCFAAAHWVVADLLRENRGWGTIGKTTTWKRQVSWSTHRAKLQAPQKICWTCRSACLNASTVRSP